MFDRTVTFSLFHSTNNRNFVPSEQNKNENSSLSFVFIYNLQVYLSNTLRGNGK